MGQKIHPGALRLGINKDWSSKWFHKKDYAALLQEDFLLRQFITEKLKHAALQKIIIERGPNLVNLIIRTAKPGLVIGRGGTGIEELKKEIQKKINTPVRLEIQEIRNPDAYAKLVAENVAEQIERRLPWRRALKQTLDRVIQNQEVSGVKIQIGGRLGGTDMSRKEWVSKGKIPLQTLRANIDFAQAIAQTSYGTIGVKVWLYKGN